MAKKQKPIKNQLFTKPLLVISVVIVLALGLVINRSYSDYREKLKIKQIISDVESIKADLENELGVKLEKEAGCTQNQGKYDGPDANWGCYVSYFYIDRDFSSKRRAIESLLDKNEKLFDIFDSTGTGQGLGYRYSFKGAKSTCGTFFGNSFSLRCSFGLDNRNVNYAKKELGISK